MEETGTNKVAHIISSPFISEDETYCVTFWYFMKDTVNATLAVSLIYLFVNFKSYDNDKYSLNYF